MEIPPSLDFLEKHLFRYRRSVYEKKQEEICIFAAESPVKELEETARRIRRLVREKNLKYGEIAVITGNLEAYKSIASQVFEESRIPYFLDEKHTILMNPFIEYIRAALEMVTKGFSYESVFRYLRCDMSGLGKGTGGYAGELCACPWNSRLQKVVREVGESLPDHGPGGYSSPERIPGNICEGG